MDLKQNQTILDKLNQIHTLLERLRILLSTVPA